MSANAVCPGTFEGDDPGLPSVEIDGLHQAVGLSADAEGRERHQKGHQVQAMSHANDQGSNHRLNLRAALRGTELPGAPGLGGASVALGVAVVRVLVLDDTTFRDYWC
jgi:hypothetical protein